MFKAITTTDLETYGRKAVAIEEMMTALAQQGLIEQNNQNVRIINTNRTNMDLIGQYFESGIIPGKLVFLAARKTIDMNLKTVQSMVNRLKPTF